MTSGPMIGGLARADVEEVERVVAAFLAAFVSFPVDARMDALRSLFLPGAVVVKTCGGAPVLDDVDGFIAPRAELLSSGELTDFREWPVSGTVEGFGDVAHWFGRYAKSGVQADVPFAGQGMKSVQLVRTSRGWRITAVAWDDERPA
jgi:hypothetical protein